MALKPANMDSCEPKCKCVQGVNAGTAYGCNSPCELTEVFNEDLCECEPTISNTCDLYLVTWQKQSFAFSSCTGGSSSSCDDTPSTAYREARVPPGYSAPYWKVTQTVNYDMVNASPTFPGCPEAPGYERTGSYQVLTLFARDANGNEAAVRGTYQSLLQIYSPAYYRRASGGGCTVYNYEIYQEGSITKLCELTNYPPGTCGFSNQPAGSECNNCPCPDGQYRDDLCECVDSSIGTWQFDGIYTDALGGTGIISQQFTIDHDDGYAFWVGDDSPYWDGGTPNTHDDWNAVTPWKSSLTMTRSSASCTGGYTTGMVLRKRSGGNSVSVLRIDGTTLQTACGSPEGTPISVSGSFTKIS